MQLVFTGEVLEGHDPATVRAAVAARMRLDGQRAERLFSGQRHVLRRGVTETAALRHIARFAQMGALLRSEPVERRQHLAPKQAPEILVELAPAPESLPDRSKPWALALLCLALGLLAGLLLGPLRATLAPEFSDAPAAETASGAVAGASTGAPSAAQARPAPAAATVTGATLIAGPAAWAAVGVPPESAQTMSVAAQREYLQTYLNASDHRAFALSDAGAHGWAAGLPNDNTARDAALRRCLDQVKNGRDACRIVGVNGRWDD